MSDDNEVPSTSDELTSDFREGELQIVEVSKFNKCGDDDSGGAGAEGGAEEDAEGTVRLQLDDGAKFMQIVDGDGKGLMQLDLLNLTLVRCGDGENEYRLVSNAEAGQSGAGGLGVEGGATVTCLLHSSDGEEQEDQYIMVEGEQEVESEEAYVMLEECGEEEGAEEGEGCLQLAPATTGARADSAFTVIQKPATTIEMLERAQALHKAKMLLRESMSGSRGARSGRGARGRPRRALPSPSEILSSPNFKLFLYSCKACSFKCNAMRDLSQHRKSCAATAAAAAAVAAAATGAGGGAGSAGRVRALQCSRCLYRGYTHAQLMRHVQDSHMSTEATVEDIEGIETSEHDVLVCGGCGYESSSKQLFRRHIALVHRAGQADHADGDHGDVS